MGEVAIQGCHSEPSSVDEQNHLLHQLSKGTQRGKPDPLWPAEMFCQEYITPGITPGVMYSWQKGRRELPVHVHVHTM